MKRHLTKQAKADIQFRRQIAEKFGIRPISLRASKLLDKYCDSADQVKEWIQNKHILKIRQMGKMTLNELFCAFGFCETKGWHHACCPLRVRVATNYRQELNNYDQIFRKRINITQLTKDIVNAHAS
jgi:hypothetical protein